MAKHKMVSVLILTCNTKPEYLKTALDSLGKQQGIDLSDSEIVVIDDFSSQKFKPLYQKIIKDHRAKYPKLQTQIFTNKFEKGIGGARNTGVGLCLAPFFGILDSDDALTKTALTDTVSRISASPKIALVFSDRTIFDESLKKIIYEVGRKKLFELHKMYKGSLCDPLTHMSFGEGFSMHRRKDVLGVFGFRKGVVVEWDLHLRLAAQKNELNFLHIPKSLYQYRHRHDSVSHRHRKKFVRGVEKNLHRVLHELGYPVSKVKFFSRIGLGRHSFYDTFVNGKKAEVPWLDRKNLRFR